jgi:hypothetical protein
MMISTQTERRQDGEYRWSYANNTPTWFDLWRDYCPVDPCFCVKAIPSEPPGPDKQTYTNHQLHVTVTFEQMCKRWEAHERRLDAPDRKYRKRAMEAMGYQFAKPDDPEPPERPKPRLRSGNELMPLPAGVTVGEPPPPDAILSAGLEVICRHLRTDVAQFHPTMRAITPATPQLRALLPLAEDQLYNDRDFRCPCYVLGPAMPFEKLIDTQAGDPPGIEDTDDWFYSIRVAWQVVEWRALDWYDAASVLEETKDCAKVQRIVRGANDSAYLAQRVETLARNR